MFSSVLSAAIVGIESHPVFVEADVSDGLPFFRMVGYLSSQVKEAEERVKTAMRNMGFIIPPKRITINLSPADIRKDGPGFDLPIAVAIMVALGYLDENSIKNIMVTGELSLDGSLHPVPGILAMVGKAREMGYKTCIVPAENVLEARIIPGMRVIGADNLRQMAKALEGPDSSDSAEYPDWQDFLGKSEFDVDFEEIQGQEAVKRAAVIAAAGFHNLLLIGPPGSGKTMVARRIPTILPQLQLEESIEISKIHSIAGLLPASQPLLQNRPFRSPHHTVSPQALAGGGIVPRPGEITLAHRGILFLDELTEFSRQSLEILRQPLEDREIHISRIRGTYRFPANCMIVAAMNPCNCGYYPDRNRCSCKPGEIKRYLSRISRPLLDRMDLCVEAAEVSFEDLKSRTTTGKSSQQIRKEISRVHSIQKNRYQGCSFYFNSEIPSRQIDRFCPLEKKALELLEKAYKKMNVSVRAYHRILKTARTIADLDGKEIIDKKHIGEAICYRSIDDKYWKEA